MIFWNEIIPGIGAAVPDGEARHGVVRQLEAVARLEAVGREDVRLARLEVIRQRIVKVVNLIEKRAFP